MSFFWGISVFAGLPVGYIDGYSFDPVFEKDLVLYELSYIKKPEQQTNLDKVIFSDNLSKEFRDRYAQKFGFTDVERNFNTSNRFTEQQYGAGVFVTQEEDQTKKQEFGNYLVRRLAEFHTDEYLKNSPKARPIYELKESISNFDVKVNKAYRMKFKYSYSGNYLDLKLENPYKVDTKVTLEMDPDRFGPTDVVESRLYVSVPVTKRDSIATEYKVVSQDASLIGKRQLSSSLSSNITFTSATIDPTIEPLIVVHNDRDERILIGLTWTN